MTRAPHAGCSWTSTPPRPAGQAWPSWPSWPSWAAAGGTAPVAADTLRIGDAEREEATTALGEHYAAGRLSVDEHAQRLDAVWRARTRGELTPLFGDLPAPHPASGDTVGPAGVSWAGPPWSRRPRGAPFPWVPFLVLLVALTVVTPVPSVLLALPLLFVLSRHRDLFGAGRFRRGAAARRSRG